MELKCDVLVVGAGPAGSMAAKTAAEGGADIVFIERNKEIGFPVRCAEGINKFIFHDTGVKKDESFIRQKINKTRIYFYDEVYDLKTDHWKGYTIDRRIFDKYLVEQAEDAGAKLFLETKASAMRKKGDKWIVKIASKKENLEIEAKIVVGAGGFDCKVGCWVGMTKPWTLNEFSKCLEYELGNLSLQDEDAFHIAFGTEFPRGYGWIFPKSKNTANVGVGINPKADTKRALNFFIKEYPGISKNIGNSYKILETRAGGIPINGPRSADQTVTDGVILVGDSAGIVEPITGEGICSAMLSGSAAGETASLCLENGSWKRRDLGIYEKLWRKKRYIDSKLGDNMDVLVSFKNDLEIKGTEIEKLLFLEKNIRKI